MKRKLVMLSAVLLCTGCAKAENVHYNSVEETVTTESHAVPTTTEAAEGETMDLYELRYFVDKDKFYDTSEELKFYDIAKNNEYGIVIKSAQVSDNLEAFGGSFAEEKNKAEIDEAVEFCEKNNLSNGQTCKYLCVEAEVTSYAAEMTSPSLRNFMGLYLCVADERGKQYGLSETRIKEASLFTEFWVDSAKQQEGIKNGYFIDIEPGETVPVRCLYIISSEVLEEDLYMELYYEKKYDTKLKCEVSSNSPDIKFLKLPQIEEVY